MRKFRVTVNGEAFDVEIEEIGGAPTFTPSPPLIAATPPQMATGPGAKPAFLLDDAGAISSPMPGTINRINVRVGDQVKAGDVLFILEAMKMENLIKADVDGTVKEIKVTKGQAVNSGDALAIIA